MDEQQPQPALVTAAIATLPEGFQPIGSIDLNRHPSIALAFNVLAFGLFVLCGLGSFRLAKALRPESGLTLPSSFHFDSLTQILIAFAVFIAVIPATIVLHEALHGVFFGAFTRQKPAFRVRLTHVYAAAPTWYIRRGSYTLIALAPLVGITVLGVLGLLWVSNLLLMPVVLLVSINAAGSAGDLIALAWLLSKPSSTLVRDMGDQVLLYGPGA